MPTLVNDSWPTSRILAVLSLVASKPRRHQDGVSICLLILCFGPASFCLFPSCYLGGPCLRPRASTWASPASANSLPSPLIPLPLYSNLFELTLASRRYIQRARSCRISSKRVLPSSRGAAYATVGNRIQFDGDKLKKETTKSICSGHTLLRKSSTFFDQRCRSS